MDGEVPLAGGWSTPGVVRIGERAAFVHRLLGYLEPGVNLGVREPGGMDRPTSARTPDRSDVSDAEGAVVAPYLTLMEADAPHRALRNSTVKAWEAAGRPVAGHRPGEGEVLLTTGDGTELFRYGDDLPTADLVGDVEPLAMYAGQSSGPIDSVQPAGVIAQTLAADAQQLFNRLAGKHT